MENPFDAKAAQWDEQPARLRLAGDVAAAIAAAVPLRKSMNALEFGCGTGLVTVALAPALAAITAVDTSAGMLDVLRNKTRTLSLPNIHPLQIDLTRDPLPAGDYDLVFSSMVFHHIRDCRAVLKTCRDLLKPGGWLAVADLDAEDGSFHGPDARIEHQGFDRADFKAALKALGFENLRDTTAATIPRQTAQGLRNYPVFLITAQK